MNVREHIHTLVVVSSSSSRSVITLVFCQICASEENCVLSSDRKLTPRPDGLHVQLAEHMSAVTFKLALLDAEKKVF